MTSLLMVQIPWDSPGSTVRFEPLTSFDESIADAPIGTIGSSYWSQYPSSFPSPGGYTASCSSCSAVFRCRESNRKRRLLSRLPSLTCEWGVIRSDASRPLTPQVPETAPRESAPRSMASLLR